MEKVNVTQHKWAGSWGPFKIKVACGECGASEDIVADVIKNDFPGKPITFSVVPWLPNWWKILLKGGWHAPIVTVNGKVIAQGKVIDRGLLGYWIRRELVKDYTPVGNIVYSKPGCKFCKKAKETLREYGVSFEDKNIVSDPLAAHELFYLTKKILSANKPVTVPQIWLNGNYFGDALKLENTPREEVQRIAGR